MIDIVTGERGLQSEWNALVEREASFSLTQSWEWGNVKSDLGWAARRIGVREEGRLVAGAQMLLRSLPLGLGSVAYIPRGPIGQWARPDIAPVLFEEIHRMARKARAVFVKMEPSRNGREVGNQLLSLGFRRSRSANHPCATIVVDISPEPEIILRSMRDSTRRKIQSTAKKGVRCRIGSLDDLPAFYRLMKTTAQRAGFTPRCFEYYESEFGTFLRKGQAAVFLAEYDRAIVAAHIVYAVGKNAAFFHQASDNTVSALNPNCLLVWEEMQWARSQGCSTYDLWGIPDEIASITAAGQKPDLDRSDGLWGVYRFKSGFSKNIVCYAGAWDYVYSPLPYQLVDNNLLDQAKLERISAWMDARASQRKESTYGST